MRYVLGVIGLLAMLVGVGNVAQADNLLGLAPLRIILTDDKTNDVISLTNRASVEHTYKVRIENQVMGPDGNVTQKDDFPYSAKRMLRFMPRKITLGAGERQTLRVMVMPPEGLAPGEYHAHLIFDEMVKDTTEENRKAVRTSEGLQLKMDNTYSVGLPLIYQHGKVTSSMKISGATLVAQKGGKPALQVTLDRTGNGEASGLLKLVEVGKDGPTSSLIQPRMARVYREVDQVTITLPMRDTVSTSLQALQGMKLQVIMEKDGTPKQAFPVE